ncbi:hypothetical protein EPUL_004785 [Erysiphe pulchra]|uniref:Integrase catalytic domain-containing protein n=1 Tax=Erysiphe pulchra TaxID=225359 RepID=A0A2S4PK20_9PEZI|nr:hypothetical protein EPUL_004785 [Erysiphe pulchra]
MGRSLKYTTKQGQPRMNNVGEGWHCDTLNPPSIEGHNYFCLTTEDVSRFRIFRALKKKSEAADELKHILTKVNLDLRLLFNLRVKQITTDGGRDWGLSTFQEFASQQEIDIVISARDNRYQNGVSERGTRFVQDAARCCTIQMKVPSVFWNYISVQKNKTPWEVYWLQFVPEKSKTIIDHLWIPGSLCITHVDASHRVTGEKLDANGSRNHILWLSRYKDQIGLVVRWGEVPRVGPREIIRSLPKHVQDRLKAQKTDYARYQDYNNPDGLEPVVTIPRGREAPLTVDNEFIHVLEGARDDIITDKETVIEDFQDAVTGRCFGNLVIEPNRYLKGYQSRPIGNQTDDTSQIAPTTKQGQQSPHIPPIPIFPSPFTSPSSPLNLRPLTKNTDGRKILKSIAPSKRPVTERYTLNDSNKINIGNAFLPKELAEIVAVRQRRERAWHARLMICTTTISSLESKLEKFKYEIEVEEVVAFKAYLWLAIANFV